MKNLFTKILFAIILIIPFSTVAQTTHNVIAGNYYFSTVNETIYAGDEVCWFNEDGYHDVNFAGYGNPQDLVDQYLSPNSGGNLGCVTFNTPVHLLTIVQLVHMLLWEWLVQLLYNLVNQQRL